jgi:cytochrome P450
LNRHQTTNALPPGPGVPAAMQLLATWKRPGASLERQRRRYGKRFTVQLPFQPPFVILADPGDIKELLTAPADAIHPGEGARVLEPIIGRNSVILLDEDAHMEQRKLMLPAFHGEKMQALTGLMSELAEREVASWPTEQAVALHPRLQRLTLEIILRAVFGLEQGARLDQLRDLLTKTLEFGQSPFSVIPAAQRFYRFVPSLKRFLLAVQQADALIFEVIEERRAAPQEDRDDVLTMLLAARHEDGSPMSPQELRDELMTALVAGHETTASELAWAFERLAREPEAMRRISDEVDAGDGDQYLTATIHEVLRLRPVLPSAAPRLVKKPIKIGDHEYPAGVALLASTYLVHRDPEIYPDPYAFRPERFLDTKPGTYTWIPFGGGRRRCLGASFALQEMKIVLRAALSLYELAPATSSSERPARRSITLSPARSATVVLRERSLRGVPAAEPLLAA